MFYTWRQRYDQHGLDGLRDRSRGPRVCPNQTRTEVVGKIVYLRQHYHFGPAKIAMDLQRYHNIQISRSRGVAGPRSGWTSTACRPPSRSVSRPRMAQLQGRCQRLVALGCVANDDGH